MLLISNNIQKYFDLPETAVIRVNMAWVQNIEELEVILNELENQKRSVFLDFPQGRNKPPKPVLNFQDAYHFCNTFSCINYFAVSNVELVENVKEIQQNLNKRIQFVPKIETLEGVKQFGRLIYECDLRVVMIDKEDLYLDVKKDNAEFFKCVNFLRSISKSLNVKLLELEGVFFGTRS